MADDRRPETGASLPPWGETRVVGRGLPRVDAYERVSGSAVYTLDMTLPDMLYAAIVRCPHAHARVRSVDVAAAARMPGVRAVLTVDDEGARIPWYATRSGALSRLLDPHCRFEGDEVAVVAAESPYQAHDAAGAVKVDYEVLPFVVDPEAALAAGAPALHEGGNRIGETFTAQRGDVEKGFAEADAVVEMSFRTSCEIHAPMETFCSVARWDGERLTVWDSTQGVFDRQQEIAEALALPLSRVRVISRYMGGGFGAKLATGKYTVLAALLARRTGRPVKVALPREDTFRCVGNRPANAITLKGGVRRDGTLVALDLVNLGGAGAYPAGTGVGSLVASLYQCPNVRRTETGVYINAGPARAMRAPGFPQSSWALEQVMDALAEKIGMDPIELRLKNVPAVLQGRDIPFTSTGLADCLREGAKAFGWKEARARSAGKGEWRRGVGVAGCMWGYAGEDNAGAIVKLFADGTASLTMGASDIGTGTKTVMTMVVCEELGLAPADVFVEHADTGTTPYSPASGGSQTVVANAPAVRAAAAAIKREVLEMAAAQLGLPADGLALAGGRVVPSGDPGKAVPLAELEGLQRRQTILAVGSRHPHPEGKIALPFAAQFAEVEVNVVTGEVRVVRMLAAHDSGRVMNLLTYRNQVFGGIVMGIGFGLTERRVLDRATGKMVNANWHDYKIPTMLDVPPELTCLPVDPHDAECNTAGAKGLGEPATIPTASAIANAIYDAVGVRVTESPVTPARMVALLAASRKEA